MPKLYFLSPDKASASNTISDLHAEGVTSQNISILAHENTGFDSHIAVEELNETLSNFGELGKNDFIPALEKGAAVGGGFGLVGGLVAMAFPPAGFIVGGGAILMSTATGAGIGAWISSMIGISAPHHDIQEYVTAIEGGSILLLVDVDAERQESIKKIITRHHPEVEIKEASALIPPAS